MPDPATTDRPSRSLIDREAAALRVAAAPEAAFPMEIPDFDDQSQWFSELSPTQREYVRLRAAGLGPRKASQAAFGTAARAKIMESNALVQAALRTLYRHVESTVKISRVKCLEIIMEAVEMARINADPVVMIAGAREIAKMQGYYEPEKKVIELTGPGGQLIQKMSQLTDEQLMEVLNSDAPSAIIDAEFTEIPPAGPQNDAG